jgi:hypothetical protein
MMIRAVHPERDQNGQISRWSCVRRVGSSVTMQVSGAKLDRIKLHLQRSIEFRATLVNLTGPSKESSVICGLQFPKRPDRR